jgi:tRNA (pseudouridine54-N1)-methyltransferase
VPRGQSFVVVGRTASAAGDFLLDDVPGTSGRLDVLLRCVRAAMLTSHALRRDVVTYLVLGGGPSAPRAVRISGDEVEFLRPDERSLAVLVKKVLQAAGEAGAESEPHEDREGPRAPGAFVPIRKGIAVARGDVTAVLDDLGAARLYVLEEGGPDIRLEPGIGVGDAAFFVGDHAGFDEGTREALRKAGARSIGLGPVSVHAEDAVTLVTNELDRRR